MAFDNIKWTMVEGLAYQAPFNIRLRDFSSLFPRKIYPTRVSLSWIMSRPSLNGLGSQAEIAYMQVFEKAVLSLVEKDRHAILSLVITASNHREYVFHTKEHNEFLRRLAMLPQLEDPFPVQVQSFDDENWIYDLQKLKSFGVNLNG